MRRVRQPAGLDRGAQALGQFERRLEVLPHPLLDAALGAGQLLRDAEPDALQVLARAAAVIGLGELQRGGVAPVASDHVPKQQRGVGHVAGQRARLIERGGERDHPVARAGAVGRLHADDPAQRRRLADRAPGVRSDRPRGKAGGHRRGASARGSSGHPPAIPGVEHRPEARVLVRGAHRELVLVGLPQQRRAGVRAAARRRWPCTAGGSPRGSSSRPGSARPRCRTGP